MWWQHLTTCLVLLNYLDNLDSPPSNPEIPTSHPSTASYRCVLREAAWKVIFPNFSCFNISSTSSNLIYFHCLSHHSGRHQAYLTSTISVPLFELHRCIGDTRVTHISVAPIWVKPIYCPVAYEDANDGPARAE